jgi:hypothetical protein
MNGIMDKEFTFQMDKDEEKESITDFARRSKDFLYDYVCDFDKVFVAGGFFPRLYHNMPESDIDLYINNNASFEEVKKEYINNCFIVSERNNFVKFQDKNTGMKIDLINFHDPKSVAFVDQFDFSVCQMIMGNGSLLCNLQIFTDVQNKALRFTGHLKHSNSRNILLRLKKYLDLGYTIDDANLTMIYKTILACAANPDYFKKDPFLNYG